MKSKRMRKVALVCLAVAGLTAGGASAAEASSGRIATCVHGDPPIQVSVVTSCPFAGNIVDYAYQFGLHYTRLYSPVTHRTYPITYRASWHSRYWATVTATGPNGIWAQFDYEE
jgi:hypothetical protein